jgi:hypothetical protein
MSGCQTHANECRYQWHDRSRRLVRCAQCGHERQTRQLDPRCCHRVCGPASVRKVATVGRERGLGDTLARWLGWLTFGRLRPKPVCGCKRRQAWLNRWWPYQDRDIHPRA